MIPLIAELKAVASEVIHIAAQPADWLAMAAILPTISTTQKAVLALVATFGAGVATTAVGVLTMNEVLGAPDRIAVVEMVQEVQAEEMVSLERRIISRIREGETRMDQWEGQFEQLRCEIIQALTGDLPQGCDRRLLRP